MEEFLQRMIDINLLSKSGVKDPWPGGLDDKLGGLR